MKKTIKKTSINQAVWRAKKRKTPYKWRHLEPEVVEDMVDMRRRGNTYAVIAEHFGVTIETVRKQCFKAGLPAGHVKALYDPMYGTKLKTWEQLGFPSPTQYFCKK